MYYKGTLDEIARYMRKAYPGTISNSDGLRVGDYRGYVCYMVEYIGGLSTKNEAASIEATLLVGWTLAVVETQLALWKHERSRELVLADVKKGFHKPH
jgi:hypothetical protein